MKTEAEIEALIKRAREYPNIPAGDLGCSFAYRRVAGNLDMPALKPQTLRITPAQACRIPNAVMDVPCVDIEVEDTDGVKIELRGVIMVAGIGSNGSKKVIEYKYAAYKRGEDCVLPVLTANLPRYVPVHGGYLSFSGPVPTTIWKDAESDMDATVGFYTPDQLVAMRATERHHDLVVLDETAFVAEKGVGRPIVFAAIWGAMEDPEDSGKPMAQSALVARTTLRRITTLEATRYAAVRLGQGAEKGARPNFATAATLGDAALDSFLRQTILSTDLCLERTAEIQGFSLKSSIGGTLLAGAEMRTDPRTRTFLATPAYGRVGMP